MATVQMNIGPITMEPGFFGNCYCSVITYETGIIPVLSGTVVDLGQITLYPYTAYPAPDIEAFYPNSNINFLVGLKVSFDPPVNIYTIGAVSGATSPTTQNISFTFNLVYAVPDGATAMQLAWQTGYGGFIYTPPDPPMSATELPIPSTLPLFVAGLFIFAMIKTRVWNPLTSLRRGDNARRGGSGGRVVVKL
jgi:hypothetical protein